MIAIVIAILVLLILAGGGAYYYMTMGNNKDCEVGGWGSCSKNGWQNRTILVEKKGNGEDCPALTKTCVAPDVDCMLGGWGECSIVTGTRKGNRKKQILVDQSGMGAVCGPTSETCTPDIDCELSGWSECKAVDSHVKYQQVKTIATEKLGGGEDCTGEITRDCSLSSSFSTVQGYNFPGNDILSTVNTTQEQCRDKCQMYKNCVGFVQEGTTCYLKDGMTGGYAGSSYISGYKTGHVPLYASNTNTANITVTNTAAPVITTGKLKADGTGWGGKTYRIKDNSTSDDTPLYLDDGQTFIHSSSDKLIRLNDTDFARTNACLSLADSPWYDEYEVQLKTCDSGATQQKWYLESGRIKVDYNSKTYTLRGKLYPGDARWLWASPETQTNDDSLITISG